MHSIDLRHPSWYRALTLTERLASLRGDRQSGPGCRRRRRSRRATPAALAGSDPFSTDGFFVRRLAADAMNKDDLRRLLGEPIEAVRDRSRSPGLAARDWTGPFPGPLPPPPSPPERGERHPLAGFLEVIEPIISQGRDRFARGDRGPGPGVRRACRSIAGRWSGSFRRPVRAAAPHDSPARWPWNSTCPACGGICGETPPRIGSGASWTHMRQRDTPSASSRSTPSSPDSSSKSIDQWVAFGLEFLRHLCTDLEAIRERFSPEGEPGTLTGVAGGLGDSHRGGRSVLIAEFRSGLRVVYKPRSLAVDVHFQELLSWLNGGATTRPSGRSRSSTAGRHGWVESVAEQRLRVAGRGPPFLPAPGRVPGAALRARCDRLPLREPRSRRLSTRSSSTWRRSSTLAEASASPCQTGQLADEAMAHSVLASACSRALLGRRAVRGGGSQRPRGHGDNDPQAGPVLENAGTDAMQLTRKRVDHARRSASSLARRQAGECPRSCRGDRSRLHRAVPLAPGCTGKPALGRGDAEAVRRG